MPQYFAPTLQDAIRRCISWLSALDPIVMSGSLQRHPVQSRFCTQFNRIRALASALTLLLTAELAHAEEDAQLQASRAAAARSLFNEARELMQAGQPEKACPKFEESLRLEHGLGTRFNLADCWQAIERNASAWSLFLDVASEARSSGQTERAEVAGERARALEPRLSYLVVSVARPQTRQRVWLGAMELGRGAWGSRWPVDIGTHEVRSEAPGFEPFVQSVRVSEPGDVISIALQPLVASYVTPTDDTKADTKALARETTEVESPPRAQDDNLARAIGLPTLLVLGVAGGGLGTYFLIHRNNLNTQASALCLDSSCSRAEFDRHAQLITDAQTAQTLGAVSLATGGACLVGAALWYFLGVDDDASTESVSLNPYNGVSVMYRRHW